MGVDARYIIRFAAAEDAVAALEATGAEIVLSKFRDGLPHCRFESGSVELTAQQDFEHRNLLVVDSDVRHLDTIFLDAAEHQYATERDLHRATRVRADIHFLSAVFSIQAGQLFYGHDLLDLDDPENLPGFTPVDQTFLASLSQFIITAGLKHLDNKNA